MPPKPNPNNIPDKPTKPVDGDVVFVLDATGSQQPYIDNVRDNVNRLLQPITNLHPGGKTRFRVIYFRDHKEQGDDGRTVEVNDFRTKFSDVAADLAKIVARGGGDGPEAQIDALEEARRSAWAPGAGKSVILITDSPPHGIGEEGDVVPASHPKKINEKYIQKIYVDEKIVLRVIGCEPTISEDYTTAVPWYTNFAKLTGSSYSALPPGASKTSRALTASALDTLDTHRISGRWEDWIMDNSHRGADALARDMHSHLSSEGEKCVDIKCAKHGGTDFSYSTEPISRAKVDAIVNRALVYKDSKAGIDVTSSSGMGGTSSSGMDSTSPSGIDISDIFG